MPVGYILSAIHVESNKIDFTVSEFFYVIWGSIERDAKFFKDFVHFWRQLTLKRWCQNHAIGEKVCVSKYVIRVLGCRVEFDNAAIVDGAGDSQAIKDRVSQIRAQIAVTTSDYDKEKLQERLAKLSGGVAVLKVGAATESELKEKKSRIEDALQATRAAVEEGIVAGGGVALVDAIGALDAVKADDKDEEVGIDIIRKAIEAPMRAIAQNAGFEGSVVVEKVKLSLIHI